MLNHLAVCVLFQCRCDIVHPCLYIDTHVSSYVCIPVVAVSIIRCDCVHIVNSTPMCAYVCIHSAAVLLLSSLCGFFHINHSGCSFDMLLLKHRYTFFFIVTLLLPRAFMLIVSSFSAHHLIHFTLTRDIVTLFG